MKAISESVKELRTSFELLQEDIAHLSQALDDFGRQVAAVKQYAINEIAKSSGEVFDEHLKMLEERERRLSQLEAAKKKKWWSR
ncbi:hypothetical protein [uncultured Cardiobacterium sp.]|uniref:hypothetical protein n=1 Tax=uncultured Cardiobacterium sp. TaxID=417619 RepID=UPI0026390BAC|nr:hypothetical protein [uncultured Cardiobacterium sp.]